MIDPRAVIDPSARLAEGVHVGPFSVIGPQVEIGEGTHIGAHVVIEGPTILGRHNRIYPYASLGQDSQDKKYRGEETAYLHIGDHNVIREFVTIHRGSDPACAYTTRLGSGNHLLAYVHIAHDCWVGDNNVFSNNATLAGHVRIGDHLNLGGFTAVPQHLQLGDCSFYMMSAAPILNVPPFIRVHGRPAKPLGVNTIGMERAGYTQDNIHAVKKAYRILYQRNYALHDAIDALRALAEDDVCVRLMVRFLEQSPGGIVR